MSKTEVCWLKKRLCSSEAGESLSSRLASVFTQYLGGGSKKLEDVTMPISGAEGGG